MVSSELEHEGGAAAARLRRSETSSLRGQPIGLLSRTLNLILHITPTLWRLQTYTFLTVSGHVSVQCRRHMYS